MFITLLTHATELNKTSNTGQLVLAVLAQQDALSCERVIWQRKLPCATLLARINAMPSALVYPSLDDQPPLPLTEPLPAHIILLDATWQQARKMYNQSPYLHPLKHLELKPERASQYRLRRNQREYGLCTSECVAQLLRLENRPVLAEQLDTELALKQTR
ncbi:tRNA-uridine aminocarboxypropyltransferase [Gilvimarinus polysaccharolyticus]|uniref:tRNA-uridine aminocarboxypropyltransferase n=1 Tax=Gilvimarinus polysaccharolyticus TaxID=863921 RepID=UPI0006739715|nr:tRNA-uridine aminocarboxypropyltransferase [Gilvimarinus polysaccharolyticus]